MLSERLLQVGRGSCKSRGCGGIEIRFYHRIEKPRLSEGPGQGIHIVVCEDNGKEGTRIDTGVDGGSGTITRSRT